MDPPWGVDWDRTRCGLGDVPLLAELLRVVSPAHGHLVCKVPPSFDPSTAPGLTPEAWFGRAAGDKHRIKFVTLTRANSPKRVGDTGFEPVTSTV